jgi:hypothetical protein
MTAKASHLAAMTGPSSSALQVMHTIRGHNAQVWCVDVSKDGTRLVSKDYRAFAPSKTNMSFKWMSDWCLVDMKSANVKDV